MASAWRFLIGGAGKGGATVAVAVVLLATALRPLIVRIRRGKHCPRSGTLKILSDPGGAKFEIVAVHGLGADPEHTWTHAAPTVSLGGSHEPTATEYGPAHNPRIHLLRDLLGPDFPEARILSFEHNSNWLTDAPVKTSEEIGNSLLREIKDKRSHLPIIFIGHSLGGIIIKQALCAQDSEEVVSDTSGIVFLGTPHLGSSVSVAGAVLAFVTGGVLGSDATLLLSLKSHDGQLSNLAARFRSCVAQNENRGRRVQIISFYETKSMYLLGWLSIGRVVPRYSAVVDADPNEEHGVDTDHSGLNKCAGRDDKLYQMLKDAIGRLRTPSRLEQADKLIRDEHYTEDRLQIDRLSGVRLPMDQCYINLAIVEQAGHDADHSNEEGTAPSQHTLLSRQKIEMPDKTKMVDLATIFSHRKGRNGGMIEPKRILIRGRAGVGKTTLCKKIVHEFTRGTWSEWSRLFDRVLWVPLRRLKGRDGPYNLGKLFHDEYFSHLKDKDGQRLAHALLDATPRNGGRTLFILDGLDEVSGEWNRDDDMSRFLKLLLSQQDVIITSRPNASLPADMPNLDLELETIGFYPDQVKAYLDADPKIKPKADAVQSFLQKHWLIQGLVRIPIQLDALCYTWEEFDPKAVPNTMTSIYTAIVQKLWKKDAVRLGKMSEAQAQTARPAEIERSVNTEIALLECLSFSGMYDDVIGFMPAHRDKIVERFKLDLPLDETLARLSFLRTSDPSSRLDDRDYHFLHLTFQEYFAARYFVRQWRDGEDRKPLDYVFKRRKGDEANFPTDPAEFLRRYKYSAHYDVFWRFVAGLLEAEGEKEILVFFHAIEKEPFDLLGPTHQRLVMHCLSEVAELPIRSSLEARLSQWLLFECDLTGSSLLATESELPDGALQDALKRASGHGRVTILRALERPGRHVSEATRTALVALFKDEDEDIRSSAGGALGRQSNLPETTVAALAALLNDEDKDARFRAAVVLGRQSNLPETTVAALVALLNDEDKDARFRAAVVLGHQSNLPETTVAALVALLKNEDEDVRFCAAEALRRQSNLPETTAAALVALLKDEDKDARRRAADALGGQSNLPKTTVAALVALLNDEDKDARFRAANALGRQSNLPETTVATLVALLKDEDKYIRRCAAKALRRQSKLPEKTVEALVALLKDDDKYIRRCAAVVLGGQLTLPKTTVAALAGVLNDEDKYIRRGAADALRRQSNLPETTVAALAALLNDEDKDVRFWAAEALGRQSNLPETTVAALVALLKNEDEDVRFCAAKALRRQSNLPETMVAALAALLNDEDKDVRFWAAEALERQSTLPETTVAALMALLKNEDKDVRFCAAEALGGQSNLPEATLTELAALLKDEDEDVCYLATDVLAVQSNLPKTTVAVLVALLKDKDKDVRFRAADALGGQSYLPETTVATLAALLKDEDKYIRHRAAMALGRQSNLPKTTVAALAALLNDEDKDIRHRAVVALGSQSTLPETTVAALVALLKDEDKSVRRRTAEAIGGQSNLLDEILKAIGLLLESEGQGETTGSTIRNPEFVESLYETFLRRSFREQCTLYIDRDSCSFNQPSGLRTASFDHGRSDQILEAIRQHRQLCDVHDYKLWDSCKGDAGHQAPSTI
ncbi:hypothetical protein Purlil1_12940 [Purpureocillium lilacinum]|uniref:NACHT domain-containing protein n=1 Tax=Purpureocillium lilacinum TaxID=33203 RepID=A0ABR0BFN2_PURLI|nr:hypothetical protein Purlil1_12940 [Purpureocillium lilacinum]